MKIDGVTIGDMAKSTYDPDADGKLALAQLIDAVCSETEAANKIAAAITLLATISDLCSGLSEAEALSMFDYFDLPGADIATILNDAKMSVARAAYLVENTSIAASILADAFDHDNLAAAKALQIWQHATVGVTTCQAIIVEMVTPSKVVSDATLADFQANPATGTMSNPSNLNDNDPEDWTFESEIGDYCEVPLKGVSIDQWRQYGHTDNTGNGRWKLEYKDTSGNWHDWVTDIPVKTTAAWTTMSSEAVVSAIAIKLSITTVDTAGNSFIGELEVYHS